MLTNQRTTLKVFAQFCTCALTIERRLTNQHLIEQDAVGPPVHALPVWLVVDDLNKILTYREHSSLIKQGVQALNSFSLYKK